MLPRARGYGRTISGPVADNFERSALGANWAVPNGLAEITASSDLGMSGDSGIHIAVWAGATLPGLNQYVEMTISADRTASVQYQVFCRRRSADLARYGFLYKNDPVFDVAGQPDGPPAWAFKYDGVPSAQTRLFGVDTGPPAPVADDRLRLEVRGTDPVRLRGFHNGKLVIAADDAAADRIITAGNVGAAYRADSGVTLTYPAKVFEDFAAGTLT